MFSDFIWFYLYNQINDYCDSEKNNDFIIKLEEFELVLRDLRLYMINQNL